MSLAMGFWDWLMGMGKPKSDPQIPAARPAASAPALPPAPPSDPAPPAAPAVPKFDVEKAIELMRKLPLDDEPELVLRIVRKTLRSTGVSIEELIRSAKARENALAEDMEKDRATIEQLERDIAARKDNIEKSTARLAETRKVRESLQEAVASESKVGILAPPPEVVARIQAEAAARAKAEAPPPKPEPAKAPEQAKPPEPTKPAEPAVAPPAVAVAPPMASKPPKPPPPLPSKVPPLPTKSAKPPATAVPPPAPPIAQPLPSVAAEEEPEDETTARRDIEIPSAATRDKDPPS